MHTHLRPPAPSAPVGRVAVAVVLVVSLTACGGDPGTSDVAADTDDPPVTSAPLDEVAGDDGAGAEEVAGGDIDVVAAAVSAIGTPDADGHVVVIEVGSQTWDFGALLDDVLCSASQGILNAHGSVQQDGATLGFELIVYDPARWPDIQDPPYVWVRDETAGVEYLAGPVPGRASVDPGDSAVTTVHGEHQASQAVAEFIDLGDPSAPLQLGAVHAACP